MRLRFIILLAAALSLGVSEGVYAAEMPVKARIKAPVHKAPVYKAPRSVEPEGPTGFYVGGHIGGGWSQSEFSDPRGLIADSVYGDGTRGFLGGVQLGYNWQFSSLVLGLQADISFTNMTSSALAPLLTTTAVRNNTKWISTLTGRVGFAWDRMLWYAKGGEAWVRNEYSMLDPITPTNAAATATRSGYVVGGGLEYVVAPGWSGFIEYNYIGLSNKTVNLPDPVSGSVPLGVKQNIQMVKIGFNAKWMALQAAPWPRW